MPIISPGGGGGGGGGGTQGTEIGYDQITASVNILGTTAAAPTTVITCAAHTFDGSPVLLEVFCASVYLGTVATFNSVNTALWEGATQIGILNSFAGDTAGNSTTFSVSAQYRFTPTAANHTYLITAYVAGTGGSPQWQAGSGGTTAASYLPSFARFTKV